MNEFQEEALQEMVKALKESQTISLPKWNNIGPKWVLNSDGTITLTEISSFGDNEFYCSHETGYYYTSTFETEAEAKAFLKKNLLKKLEEIEELKAHLIRELRLLDN